MKPPDPVAVTVPPQLAGEYVDRDPPLVPRPPNGLQNGVVEPLEDGVGEALREVPGGHELCEGVEEGGAEGSLPVEEVHLAGDVGDGGRCHFTYPRPRLSGGLSVLSSSSSSLSKLNCCVFSTAAGFFETRLDLMLVARRPAQR